MFDSPIEFILAQHIINHPLIIRNGIRVQSQVPLGPFRVDLMLFNYYGYPLCIIECDGRAYHWRDNQRSRDNGRAREIERWTRLRIIRFTGSQINRNANKCVEEILRFLQFGVKPIRRWG